MSIATVVLRGYGSGGSIAAVVQRGYSAGEQAVEVQDPYAAQGWATRDFYTPYWMGIKRGHDIGNLAKERARFERRAYGTVPPEAEQVIDALAAEQAESEDDEIDQFIELNEAITKAKVAWEDHYGGHLKALRAEYAAAKKAKQEAEDIQAKADEAERAELWRQAEAEIERRETAKRRRKRNNKILSTALLMSAA